MHVIITHEIIEMISDFYLLITNNYFLIKITIKKKTL